MAFIDSESSVIYQNGVFRIFHGYFHKVLHRWVVTVVIKFEGVKIRFYGLGWFFSCHDNIYKISKLKLIYDHNIKLYGWVPITIINPYKLFGRSKFWDCIFWPLEIKNFNRAEQIYSVIRYWIDWIECIDADEYLRLIVH